MLTRCLPCRGWLAWRPWLRTLLLDLLLIYVSVPFLIRLFPVLLTKFVFLNFCECPGAVPTGRAPSQGFRRLGGVPKTWVGPHPAPGWHRDSTHPNPPLLRACRGGTEGPFPLAPRVLQAVITRCRRPCLLPEVATHLGTRSVNGARNPGGRGWQRAVLAYPLPEPAVARPLASRQII